MARGKYAARAANTRATEAQQSATQLRDLLAAERLEHARKIADLNGRVAQLQGRLDREVRELSDAEIKRMQKECASTLAAAEGKRLRAGTAVLELLSPADVSLPASIWQQLVTLLDVPGFALGSRTARRSSGKKLVAAATRYEQSLDRVQRQDGVRRRFVPLTAEDARREADRRQAEVDRIRQLADEMEADGLLPAARPLRADRGE